MENIRCPHKYFIAAAIVAGYGPDSLLAELEKHGLPVNFEHVKEIIEYVKIMNPQYRDAKSHEDDWLKDMGIFEMYYYLKKKSHDEDISGPEGAFKILDNIKLRRVVESLSFAGFKREELDLICASRLDVNFEPRDYLAYVQYFANFEGWKHSDKHLYVGETKDAVLRSYLKTALEQDNNYLLWKLELAPNKSFDDMLTEMMEDCFYYFKEKMEVQPEEATKFATLAIRIADKIANIKEDTGSKKTVLDEIQLKLTAKTSKDSGIQSVKDLEIEVPAKNQKYIEDIDKIMHQNEEEK